MCLLCISYDTKLASVPSVHMSSANAVTTPSVKSDPIIIIGAGIFGLSTAIYLLQRGYQDITIFDKQPYERTKYSYFKGCDAASADTNKIIRSAYGTQTEYQTLSTEALIAWKQWNHEIASAKFSLPDGMTRNDKVFINNGNLSLTDKPELPDFELSTISNMSAAGHVDTQLITTDPRHVSIAEQKGFAFAIDPFRRKERGKGYLGVLDTTGGMALADKACCFALHKAKTLGAKLRLGPGVGESESFLYSTSSEDTDRKAIVGIKTADGQHHHAAKSIVACGGWTPSLLSQLDGLCETTAGSLAMLRIPRESSLWDRLAPERFPTYTWKVRDGAEGGIYGFPRDEHGILKIGYRGTKYTNPQTEIDEDGKERERSVPVTRYTEGEKIEGIPKQAMKVLQRLLDEFLPGLGEEGIRISMTRLCWYTDSFDNHFVIDHVPGQPNVMVATAGSGHAFKYLPVIGRYVADVMEGVGLEREIVTKWKWRTPKKGEEVVNVLMEGRGGARALGNVEIVRDAEINAGVKAIKARQ